MSQKKSIQTFWRNVLIPLIILVLLYFIGDYLLMVFNDDGTEKFIYSLVLVSSLVVGVAHIILYVARRSLEKKNSREVKQKKRRLERYRNIVNYITPFVLFAMLYHFWQKELVLAAIIVVILLLDRLNELLRGNK